MTPIDILEEVRAFYTAMWPEDDFPVEEAIELLAEWED